MAKIGSLTGEHIEQHYSWAFLLAKSLKQFQFPWWTNLIHCGFPLAAESQIGVFYLPNLILCFLLPIHWAYSYLNVIHFLISGWATYFYGRSMKLGPLAAFISAVFFLFGSAYGGAYYNILSLKTVAWFPVSLFFFEQFYETGKWKHLLFFSCAIALMLLAGYLQVAAFVLAIIMLYGFLRIFIIYGEKNLVLSNRLKNAGFLLLAIGASILIAFPQLFLTFRLVLFSNRLKLSEDYAYVGSTSPLVVLTFFFTQMQGFLRGNSLYGGVFSIFFILCAFFSNKSRKTELFRIWCWVGLISFLMALGRWSPLYVAIIKLTHFYSFRMPSKFLVFVCFAAAMLSGVGIQAMQDSIQKKTPQFSIPKATFTFSVLLSFASAAHVMLYYFVSRGRPIAIAAGQWFVRRFVYEKIGHPYTLEVYNEKLRSSLDSIQSVLTFHNSWNIWSYVFFFIGLIFVFFLYRMKDIRRGWLIGAVFFLLFDLYIFAACDIKRDFDSYDKINQRSAIIEHLEREQAQGNLGRLYELRDEKDYLPVLAGGDMIHGFEDIGAYSPLVMKRYHETIGHFGTVNDSNFAFTPTMRFIEEHFNLLSSLDVSHILSKRAIAIPDISLVMYDIPSATFLYKNEKPHTRAFFVSKVQVFRNWPELKERLLQPGFDPRKIILFESSEVKKGGLRFDRHFGKENFILKRLEHDSDSELWFVEANQPGFFVLSNTMYPGWTATLNEAPVPVLAAYGLFQSVWIEKAGRYKIQFRYRPFS